MLDSRIAAVRSSVQTVARAPEKLEVHECVEKRLGCRRIKPPQPLHFILSKLQARYLEVLRADKRDTVGNRGAMA